VITGQKVLELAIARAHIDTDEKAAKYLNAALKEARRVHGREIVRRAVNHLDKLRFSYESALSPKAFERLEAEKPLSRSHAVALEIMETYLKVCLEDYNEGARFHSR
jgi:hypothetical protein